MVTTMMQNPRQRVAAVGQSIMINGKEYCTRDTEQECILEEA